MIFGSDEDVDTVIACTQECAEVWNRYTKLYRTNVALRAFCMVIADGATKQPEPIKAIDEVCKILRMITGEMLSYDKGEQK